MRKKMPQIQFGPAGLGPVKDAVKNLELYAQHGLKACEIAFTYSIYIKNDPDIKLIKEAAKKHDITLSIHAPYWLNLNSSDRKKIEQSKERILKCCEVGEQLGCYRVVFHPGYYGKMTQEESYENIKNAILDLQSVLKKKNWKIKIAVETMGKVNVFGSIDHIARLIDDTGCEFCIDFAHILAREKKVDYDKIRNVFSKHKVWHCHFSGIVYGEKGEKHHRKTESEEWKTLLKELKKLPDNITITIINESPSMIEDSIEGLKLWKKL
jgi:deoxyribonuclease-4